jgi:hypothetical protein
MTNKKEVLHNEKNEIVLAETFGTFYEQLEKMEATHKDAEFDISTKKGEKEARSFIYNLRRSKSPVNDAHKIAKAEAKALCDALDAGKRDIVGRIDGMIQYHEKPIKEKEEAEKARIEGIKERIEAIEYYIEMIACMSSSQIHEVITKVETELIDESYAEFQGDAAIAKDNTLQKLKTAFETTQKQEAEAAELERLRKEKADAERAEREAQIAQEAAAKAEREKQEAIERAEREKQAALAKAEADKQAAIEAERRRIEQEQQKAEFERQQEANKQAAILAEQQAIEKARVENEQHRANIHSNVQKRFQSLGLNEEWSHFLTQKIIAGEIPELQIKY